MANNMSTIGQMHSLRRQNLLGQLKFADEVANYNNQMQAAKFGVLGSIVGAVAGVGGTILGGPAGGAAASTAAKAGMRGLRAGDSGAFLV
jgi:hypothetical protein